MVRGTLYALALLVGLTSAACQSNLVSNLPGAATVDGGIPAADVPLPSDDGNRPPAVTDAGQPIADAGQLIVDAGQPTTVHLYDHAYFVSPQGSDQNPGTREKPFKTINFAVRKAQANDLVTVTAGTYAEVVKIDATCQNGTANKPIDLQGEGEPKLIPAGGGAVLAVSRRYWIVEGFEVDLQSKAVGYFGVALTGDLTGTIIRKNHIHSGSVSAGVSTHASAQGVTVEQNLIHNFDRGSMDAHGIVIQPTSKNVTLRGNRIYNNSGDSIQCLGPESISNDPPADGLVIEDNDLSDDQENAVDIKTCYNVRVRRNLMHDYSREAGCAMVIHMSPSNVVVEDNDIRNVGRVLALGGNRVGPMPAGVIFRRNRLDGAVVDATKGLPGVGITIQNADAPLFENNSFRNVGSWAVQLGDGVNGPSSAVRFVNNIFDSGKGIQLGSQSPYFSADYNLYRTGILFSGSFGTVDLAGWKSHGLDVHSPSGASPLCDASFVPVAAAVNAGTSVGDAYCGTAPDIGAVEVGCP